MHATVNESIAMKHDVCLMYLPIMTCTKLGRCSLLCSLTIHARCRTLLTFAAARCSYSLPLAAAGCKVLPLARYRTAGYCSLCWLSLAALTAAAATRCGSLMLAAHARCSCSLLTLAAHAVKRCSWLASLTAAHFAYRRLASLASLATLQLARFSRTGSLRSPTDLATPADSMCEF